MAANRILSLGFSAVFFLSGVSALIYQVCWQRLLGIHYGVGAVASAIVVSIFMLGLGLGAVIGGRLSARAGEALRHYLVVEILIGLFGISSIGLLGEIANRTAGGDYLITAASTALFLMVPTVLMGTTLPLAVAILRRTGDSVVGRISFYYFINTIGAAAGTLVTSYGLISFLGVDGAIATAAVLNGILACAMIALSRQSEAPAPPVEALAADARPAGDWPRQSILPLLFVNGFLAIGYQIVWYRIVGVLLKDSAYSFSTTLAVYLLAIATGSWWVHAHGRRWWRSSEMNLYLLLSALVGVTALTTILFLATLTDRFPLAALVDFSNRFSVLPHLGVMDDWRAVVRLKATVALTLLWPAVVLLVPGFLMGAAFPVGLALLPVRSSGFGPSLGLGYGVTIVGNALGGLVTSFLLLPALGTLTTLSGFAALQSAQLLLLRGEPTLGPRLRALRAGALAAVAVAAALMPSSSTFYRKLVPNPSPTMFFREGLDGVMMAFNGNGGIRNLINGQGQGHYPSAFSKYQTMVTLSHAPVRRNVLVIGFGVGNTVQVLKNDETVESITVVELVRTSIENLESTPQIRAILDDPRIQIVFDDGRRFLHRNTRAFDVVLMDPIRTRSAFSNNVYSEEFFRLVKANLTPHGVFMLWSDDKAGGKAKAVARVFEQVKMFRSRTGDAFMVASASPLLEREDTYERLLEQLPSELIAQVSEFESGTVCSQDDLLALTAPPQRDLKPYGEYFLGALVRDGPGVESLECGS